MRLAYNVSAGQITVSHFAREGSFGRGANFSAEPLQGEVEGPCFVMLSTKVGHFENPNEFIKSDVLHTLVLIVSEQTIESLERVVASSVDLDVMISLEMDENLFVNNATFGISRR